MPITETPLENIVEFFLIVDKNPKIGLAESRINGDSLSNFESLRKFTPKAGDNIEFDIFVASGTISAPLKALVVFAPWYPFIESSLTISITKIEMVANANSFSGNVKIPSETTI